MENNLVVLVRLHKQNKNFYILFIEIENPKYSTMYLLGFFKTPVLNVVDVVVVGNTYFPIYLKTELIKFKFKFGLFVLFFNLFV